MEYEAYEFAGSIPSAPYLIPFHISRKSWHCSSSYIDSAGKSMEAQCAANLQQRIQETGINLNNNKKISLLYAKRTEQAQTGVALVSLRT
jgi:hypothetical protein